MVMVSMRSPGQRLPLASALGTDEALGTVLDCAQVMKCQVVGTGRQIGTQGKLPATCGENEALIVALGAIAHCADRGCRG